MPVKRSWDKANQLEDVAWERSSSSHILTPTSSGQTTTRSFLQAIPQISRKVKACAACRKHKVRGCTPYFICLERNWANAKTIDQMHHGGLRTAVQTMCAKESRLHTKQEQRVLEALNMPAMPRLRNSRECERTVQREDRPEDAHLRTGPSCDTSPVLAAADDKRLPHVPMHSVYRLTKLSALRSPGEAGEADKAGKAREDLADTDTIDDMISRGKLALADAERLYRLYMDHLDHFMYGIGGVYGTLEALRRSSRILAAAIFTVGALHEGGRNQGIRKGHEADVLYSTCMAELRRLMAASLFSRRVDRDQVRAMCIASYWLSDISWTLSGHAIRRAAELDLAGQHARAVTEGAADAADGLRLWYVLYICDQHLSTLYGRRPVIRADDDAAVRGWEAFAGGSPTCPASPAATDEDRRLASQVALVGIVQGVRELFGDLETVPPTFYAPQIAAFARQLDRWLARWSAILPAHHDRIGGFPRKGVMLHHRFATLHLHSQVFRGSSNGQVPLAFRSSAAAAVEAATAIIELLITDPEMRPALVGMPAYMHAMTGYACMFLAKLAMLSARHDRDDPSEPLIQRSVVLDLTARLIALYRSVPVGRWHLVHLMANGLDKVADTLRKQDEADAQFPFVSAPDATFAAMTTPMAMNFGDPGLDAFDLHSSLSIDSSTTFGSSPFLYLSNGPSTLDSVNLSPSFL